MGFIAMFGVGFMLVSLIVCTQLSCRDENIGLATLVLGSVRAMGGSVAVSLFTSIIQNTTKKDSEPRVGGVVLLPPYNVPRTSLPKLIALVIGGKDGLAARLPGVTPAAVKATRQSLKYTWALAFQSAFPALSPNAPLANFSQTHLLCSDHFLSPGIYCGTIRERCDSQHDRSCSSHSPK
jgi:hypothetical protein